MISLDVNSVGKVDNAPIDVIRKEKEDEKEVQIEAMIHFDRI